MHLCLRLRNDTTDTDKLRIGASAEEIGDKGREKESFGNAVDHLVPAEERREAIYFFALDRDVGYTTGRLYVADS